MSDKRKQDAALLRAYEKAAEAALQDSHGRARRAASQSLTRHIVWREGRRPTLSEPPHWAQIFAGAGAEALQAPRAGGDAPLNEPQSAALIGGRHGWAQAHMRFVRQDDASYALAVSAKGEYARLRDAQGRKLRGPKPHNPVLVFGFESANDNAKDSAIYNDKDKDNAAAKKNNKAAVPTAGTASAASSTAGALAAGAGAPTAGAPTASEASKRLAAGVQKGRMSGHLPAPSFAPSPHAPAPSAGRLLGAGIATGVLAVAGAAAHERAPTGALAAGASGGFGAGLMQSVGAGLLGGAAILASQLEAAPAAAQNSPGDKGAKGADGPQGPPGEKGATSSEKGGVGAPGPKGEAGEKGAPGPQGPYGGRGEQGAQGFDGVPGAKGGIGEEGFKGEKGDKSAGERGMKGEIGSDGPPGDVAGPKGVAGERGPKGLKGNQGMKGGTGQAGGGLHGAPGEAGAAGEKGQPGRGIGLTGAPGEPGEFNPFADRGAAGDKGEKGFAGEPGLPGEPGAKGFQGLQGPRGDDGVRSPKGEEARDPVYGYKGVKGGVGDRGETGERGEKGGLFTRFLGSNEKGSSGMKGDPGAAGETGEPGLQGEKGAQGAATASLKGAKGATGDKGAKGEKGLRGLGVSNAFGQGGVSGQGARQQSDEAASTTRSLAGELDRLEALGRKTLSEEALEGKTEEERRAMRDAHRWVVEMLSDLRDPDASSRARAQAARSVGLSDVLPSQSSAALSARLLLNSRPAPVVQGGSESEADFNARIRSATGVARRAGESVAEYNARVADLHEVTRAETVGLALAAGVQGNTDAALRFERRVRALEQELREGTAVAISLGGFRIPNGREQALSLRFGYFEEGTALSAQYGRYLRDDLVLELGVGIGLDYQQTGYAAGLVYGW